MKLTLRIASIVLASSGLASAAASVTVACFTDTDVTTNPINYSYELNSTWTAKVGVFDGTALTANSVFSDINSHWTNVGSNTFATGGSIQGVNGWFSLSAISYDSVATGLGGKNVWVWITNGTNGNLVMEATGAAVGNYLYKNNTDIPATTVLAVKGTAVNAWTLSLGTYTNTGANAGLGGSYVVNMAAVPEPSAALLGAFGVLGLLRRRRA